MTGRQYYQRRAPPHFLSTFVHRSFREYRSLRHSGFPRIDEGGDEFNGTKARCAIRETCVTTKVTTL